MPDVGPVVIAGRRSGWSAVASGAAGVLDGARYAPTPSV
jgi:hypothetical protein